MTKKRFTDVEVDKYYGLICMNHDEQFHSYSEQSLEDLLNQLHEENKQLKSEDKNCYNCKHSKHFEDGDTLCEKGCMNIGGYFDYEYHQFKERCICPLWECEDDEGDYE